MTTTETGADVPPSPDGPDVTRTTATTGTKSVTTARNVTDPTDGSPGVSLASGPASAPGPGAGSAPGAVTDHDRGVHGYHHEKQEHLKRLRRIEGQIRGLQRMVDEDVYCIDILTQVSASTKALQSFALQLLEEHLRHCVADAALKGGDEIDAKVKEATQAIARMLRT
ncbi:DNA-binding transcriptional regulator, FrmR family [Streptomyces prasinopilosus]|uniref:DNA-binding transcriptional regulator, FrmR family n=1 Tax=Streptomyces prasinopilosus TaxID=67344 RepID=A0A1G6Q824_9ACTN|nr:metal-sensitive transcriptional regulator [Streptomyces prasinopilosus]SDC88489.1 DNA-binding transcriptional regulator, FrmR family [Streptomyces prasinopilosus]